MKAIRAEHHFKALKRYITKKITIDANHPRIDIKFDTNTGEHVLYVGDMPDLRRRYARVGLILGDCVNNLRAALDYIVYEAGLLHTHGSLKYPDRIKFPISDRRDRNVWRSIEGNQLREVGPRQRAIIKRFQPFKGWSFDPRHGAPYHPLSLLRDLSDMDKHRLLTAVVVPVGYGGIWYGGNLAGAIFANSPGAGTYRAGGAYLRKSVPAELGAELGRAKLDAEAPKHHVKMACAVAGMEVTFADEYRRPVLPVVESLGAMVVKILRELEPTLKRPPKPRSHRGTTAKRGKS